MKKSSIRRSIAVPGPQDVVMFMLVAIVVVVVAIVSIFLRLWCRLFYGRHHWHIAHRDCYGTPEYRCKCCGKEKNT